MTAGTDRETTVMSSKWNNHSVFTYFLLHGLKGSAHPSGRRTPPPDVSWAGLHANESMSSLCNLLAEPRDPYFPVARRWDPGSLDDRVFRWQELRQHVSALRDRIAGEPAGPWVLLTDDAYTFAVGLLALWHAGRHAISPPNRQPGTLRTLQTRAAGVLCDGLGDPPEGSSLRILIEDSLIEGDSGRLAELAPLSPEAAAVELFTSGTTGAEKPVIKRIRHLEDEVRELSSLWDEQLGDATVFATASHQHLYGLLFGVLWPLCAGRTFRADHFLQPDELVPRIRGEFALAGVPTHLKHLARHPGSAVTGPP